MVDEIIAKILGYIEKKELSAGQKLPPERVLSAELGVNRTSLREALAVLEYMRYIRRVQGSGIYLLDANGRSFEASLDGLLKEDGLSPEEAFEIYEAVTMIEGVIGQLAAVKRSAGEIAELRDNVRRAEELLAGGGNTYKLDVEFHRRIALMSRNTFLVQISTSFWLRLSGYARLIQAHPGRAADLLDHHRRIVEAIEKGDAARTDGLVKMHYRYSLDFVRQTLPAGNGGLLPAGKQ